MMIAPVIFPEAATIEIMDGVACAMLAAAAAARARNFGAALSGAVALACICGLLAPLLRETFMHGAQGSRLIITALPDDVLIGALCGAFAPRLFPAIRGQIFFWADSLGLALASVLCAVLVLRECGIAGALVLGLCVGLAPGFCRDVALGDTAMLVERNWYAASALIGCIVAIICLFAMLAWDQNSPILAYKGEISIIIGVMAILGIRAWKDRDISN